MGPQSGIEFYTRVEKLDFVAPSYGKGEPTFESAIFWDLTGRIPPVFWAHMCIKIVA